MKGRNRRIRATASVAAIGLLGVAGLIGSSVSAEVSNPRAVGTEPTDTTSKSPDQRSNSDVLEQAFSPPPRAAVPDDDFGKVVQLGADIFHDTQKNASVYVGNALQCSNCHIDDGRQPNSAPMWAAYVAYPAYRAKNGHVNTFAERLQGCFRFSMNGKAPPLGDKVLVALESYAYFLASKAPVGADMPGRGYPKLQKAKQLDRSRGQAIYTERCALCHNGDGSGRKSALGRQVFPPLWGPSSYNWGAGMTSIANAAGFIKANMPLGQGGTLSDQDAWDVAAYVDGQERPQDPRFTGSVEKTRKMHHNTPLDLYGTVVDGVLLGERSPPAGPREN